MSAVSGCGRDGQAVGDAPCVGVTTSYIECAVRDLAPDRFRIVRLLPPGGCPGHFDVTPKMIEDLRGAGMLFRFDFQRSLDAKLERLKAFGLEIVPVPAGEGMGLPGTYERVCQAVCEALSQRWPAEASRFRSRLASVRPRLGRLGNQCRRRIKKAGLTGTKVLSSGHQEGFCKWLGLRVVGTIPRGEAARISELTEGLEKGETEHVKLVVGNLQEGPRVARTLAKRLGVRLVVFSNFPSMARDQMTFDDLVRWNVGALVGSVSRPSSVGTGSAPGRDGGS